MNVNVSFNSMYNFALLEEIWSRAAKQTRSPASWDPCPRIISHSLGNTQEGQISQGGDPRSAHHSESFLTKAPHLSGSRPEASNGSSSHHH